MEESSQSCNGNNNEDFPFNRPPDEVIKIGVSEKNMPILRAIINPAIEIVGVLIDRLNNEARQKLNEYLDVIKMEYGKDRRSAEYEQNDDLPESFARVNTRIMEIMQNYLGIESEYSIILMLAYAIVTFQSLGVLAEQVKEHLNEGSDE